MSASRTVGELPLSIALANDFELENMPPRKRVDFDSIGLEISNQLREFYNHELQLADLDAADVEALAPFMTNGGGGTTWNTVTPHGTTVDSSDRSTLPTLPSR